MVNATATAPASPPRVLPPPIPPLAPMNTGPLPGANQHRTSFKPVNSISPLASVAVKTADLPRQPSQSPQTAFRNLRETPTIVKPDAQPAAQSKATNKSSKPPAPKMKMALIAAGLILGVLGVSTGLWMMSSSQDIRQQAYTGQTDDSSFEPTSSPTPVLLAQANPTPTPILLAQAPLKSCGESCSSNDDCNPGNVCSSTDGYRCVLSACVEATAVCDALKCSLLNTPLSGSTGGASATSSAMATSTAAAKTATASTTRATQPASTQALPVSGSVGTTVTLMSVGVLFMVAGFWAWFRQHQLLDFKERS